MTALLPAPAADIDAVARNRVRRSSRRRVVVTVLAVLVVVVFVATLMIGRTFYPLGDVARVVLGERVGPRRLGLMAMIAALLDCPVEPVEAAGLDGDMLEAQAFAHLAVRVARGLPTSCPGTTGVAAAVGGGKISRPRRR